VYPRSRRPGSCLVGGTVLLFVTACGGSDAPDAVESAAAAFAADAEPAAAGTAAGPDAFAPKAVVRADLDDSNARMRRMILDAAVVPGRAEVGVPPYPGARVVQVQAPGSEQVNDVVALPLVWLISDNEPEAVVEFYRRELSGWSLGEFYLNTWFWEGDGPYNPIDESGLTMPGIGVMAALPGRADMFPGTRSEIQIRYRP